jgi:hypothetical protein
LPIQLGVTGTGEKTPLPVWLPRVITENRTGSIIDGNVKRGRDERDYENGRVGYLKRTSYFDT